MAEFTPSQENYAAAMRDAVSTLEQLTAAGREDRAAGLAVGVDLGTSAAFLFSLDDRAYENATRAIRAGIELATRED